MIELSKEAFSININKRNPLDLKGSYENNVFAFKNMLDLSYIPNTDNNTVLEFQQLGNQIVDSFRLLCILNKNQYLKKYIKSFNILVIKLHETINKQSKFEKMLRSHEFSTSAFISDRYMFGKDIKNNYFDVKKESARAINSNHSYLIYNKYLENEDEGYSFNDIIYSTDLFRRIICKDSKCIFSNVKQRKRKNINRFTYSKDTNELITEKNDILKQLISSDDSIINEGKLMIDSINEMFKGLFALELKISVLDNLLNKLLYDFSLEKDVEEIYNVFKKECEENLSKSIKENYVLNRQLSIKLHDYNMILSNSDIKSYYELSKEMSQLRSYYMRNYLAEKRKHSKLGKYTFVKYLQSVILNDTELIDIEKKRNQTTIEIYSEYLVYLSGISDGEKALSFDEYSYIKYGIKNIDTDIFDTKEEEYKKIA